MIIVYILIVGFLFCGLFSGYDAIDLINIIGIGGIGNNRINMFEVVVCVLFYYLSFFNVMNCLDAESTLYNYISVRVLDKKKYFFRSLKKGMMIATNIMLQKLLAEGILLLVTEEKVICIEYILHNMMVFTTLLLMIELRMLLFFQNINIIKATTVIFIVFMILILANLRVGCIGVLISEYVNNIIESKMMLFYKMVIIVLLFGVIKNMSKGFEKVGHND
ncbi:MAG: hypothetical protein J6L69_06900 [Lachnospiraceae bacterium]|nr:hypothetical protein [Lachnospiraceae bacterium]